MKILQEEKTKMENMKRKIKKESIGEKK